MPRYFFHLHDGRDMPDVEGAELADKRAVWAQAVETAGAMLRDLDGEFSGEERLMEVTDEAGLPVLTLRFSATEHAR